ncbi:hypothetical protein [Pseudonocardia sp.]|nr:hypothetical protein [Pseudonocardia sp.]
MRLIRWTWLLVALVTIATLAHRLPFDLALQPIFGLIAGPARARH